jgi:phosphatidylglycerol---prolipoprotein diacylglyceryl transferase
MPTSGQTTTALTYPRYFQFAGQPVNSYKVFLCVGIYLAILASAAAGVSRGFPPLRLGLALLTCGLVGLVGARLYHLGVYYVAYRRMGRLSLRPRTSTEGGWSVFGGLLIVPASLLIAPLFALPFASFWDQVAVAIAVGGGWIRFGCVCNGCCVGRASHGWFALRQHDVHGIVRRRVPVQWMEIGWWLLACAGLVWLWPMRLPAGSYAFAVLAWYGAGRAWLEPLRERPDTVAGRVRVNQLVAAALALVAGAGLVLTLR